MRWYRFHNLKGCRHLGSVPDTSGRSLILCRGKFGSPASFGDDDHAHKANCKVCLSLLNRGVKGKGDLQ